MSFLEADGVIPAILPMGVSMIIRFVLFLEILPFWTALHLILCLKRPMMVGRVNIHGLSGSLWRTNIFACLYIIFHGAHTLFYMKLTMQDMYLSGAHEQFLRKRSRSKKMLTEWGVPLASAEVVNKVLNL